MKTAAQNAITAATAPVYHDRLRTTNVFGNIFRCFDPDPEPKDPVDPPAVDPKKKPDDKPAKVQLTEDELEAKLEDARKAERDKLATIAADKKKADDLETAKKNGEYETIATTEKKRADDLELKLKTRDHTDGINKEVTAAAKAHPGYTAEALEEYVVKPLLLTLPLDTSAADIKKAATAAVKKYAEAHPLVKKTNISPPPANRSGLNGGGSGVDEQNPTRPMFSGAAAQSL